MARTFAYVLCGLTALLAASCASSQDSGQGAATVNNANNKGPDRNTAVGATVSNADSAFSDMGNQTDPPRTNRPANTAGQPSANTNTGNNAATPMPPANLPPLSPKPERKLTFDEAKRLWLEERVDPRYPRSNFLLGFGSGGDLQAAAGTARAEIAAYFKTQVASQHKSFTIQVVESRNGAPAAVQEFLQSQTALETLVLGTVDGTEVVDSYVSGDRRLTLALVVMDRVVFAENMKVKIDALKNELKAALEGAAKFKSKGAWINALGSYRPCVDLFNRLAALIVEYNLGKPSHYPQMSLDIDLAEILRGMLECGWQMTVAFHLEVNFTFKDGRTERRSSTAVEEQVVKVFAQKKIGLTVVRTNPAFLEMPDAQIRKMQSAEIAKLLSFDGTELKDVNYVVIGKFNTRYIGDMMIPNQGMGPHVKATYDLQLLELKSGNMWPIGDAVGRGQGLKSDEEGAAGQAVTAAAKLIAEDLVKSFSAK